MDQWKEDRLKADYACDFREAAKASDQRGNGRNVVSHRSVMEVQASDNVKAMINWRCEGSEHFGD